MRRQRSCRCYCEQKQLTPEQEKIGEINSGIYAFKVAELFARIDQLSTDNPHAILPHEIAAILQHDGLPVLALRTAHASEVLESTPAASWRNSIPFCVSVKRAS